ncbi:MAG TPA: FtsX-like permease family protein [Acetobacteraceae bacterium]|nr:FtsX-like permease family protein [Acetobacteraceae bacterium]
MTDATEEEDRGDSVPWSFFLAVRLARRGLRAGARGLWIALACLALGVAAIAGIGSLRASLAQGLARSGRQLLGGDLEVSTGEVPVPASLKEWFGARGARVSEVALMHAMLIAPSGKRELVSLKAADRRWPLAGAAQFAPALGVRQILEGNGLAAAPLVLDRLGLHVGETVTLGRARFVLRAALVSVPDQVATPALLGPPVLIGLGALPGTGLVVPGSLVRYALRVALPAGAGEAATRAALARDFPEAGWEIRDTSQAAPGLQRFLDRAGLFMTLVALTALLVGGIGVVGGVGAWAEARLPTIAILRALGASSRLMGLVLGLQVLALSMIGIAVGVAAGAMLAIGVVFFFGAELPVPSRLGLCPGPLALGAAFGLATALLCMVWPIVRAARVSGAALFRAPLVPARARLSPGPVVLTVALVGILLALAVVGTGSERFVLLFAAAASVSLVALALAGRALMRLAAGLAPEARTNWARASWLRLGLADLHRPGAATVLMVVSVGLGLATLGAIALIEGNLNAELSEEIPARGPSFYFIDIQNDEIGRFAALMRSLPGVEAYSEVPMLRARVAAIDGVPVAQAQASHETRWALNQDLGLTYAAVPPPGNQITQGRWWPADYRGPPLLSLDARLAAGWGVRVGGTLTLNVLGRPVTFRVASLRDIPWQRLGLNFFLVASPGLLSAAPHTHIATVRAAPADQAAVLRAVTDALPNVSAIAVADVIAAVAKIFGQLAAALAALAGVALAAGVLVLAGAVAAEGRRRVRQAVILKTLGATRAQIRAAWLVGFGAEGAVAGVIAALVATGASYGVVRYLMGGRWVFLPVPLAIVVGSAIVLLLIAGYAGTGAALRARAAPWLRNE